MKTRPLAALAVAIAITALLVGCSGSPTSGTSGEGEAQDDPTLSASTLPTEVGTKWTTTRSDGTDIPIEFTVAGPWTLEAGDGWSETPSEIVDPATVPGIEKFDDVDFVIKNPAPEGGGPVYYYPRRLTDEWVQGLGRIMMQGDAVTPEPSEVSNFWPLDLEVGKEYQVADTDEYESVATVLARNTATVPAGTIADSYLVRFRATLKTDGKVIDNYYLFAGDVGMVAWLSELTGSEEAGFTSSKNLVLLSSLPAK